MAMVSSFEEDSKVAILTSSLAGQYKLPPIAPSVDTLSKDKVTSSYVSGTFVEEYNRLRLMFETSNNSTQAKEIGQDGEVT